MSNLSDTLQGVLGDTYRIERELGGGGMSRVFVATELALGRRVVIKLLPPELAESISADRFHREIQVAANLQHPRIVPLLTAGNAGGFLYYTMPFVEGETLRGRINRQGELTVADSCRILAEVAGALSYAHRHGIVHRDIKPENILLSEGEAQVADFGIAKALAASAGEGTLTTQGLVLGTPAYMAPEQAAGDSSADARGDLYSLGVVAYEMLSGSPPFSERTSQAMMAAHAVRRPAPVSERRPATPARLASLVMRLLEKHSADRPQSADEVLRELDNIAKPSPVTVATTGYHPEVRRGRWLVAGAVAALALALTAWLRSRTPAPTLDPKVVAVVPFRVTGADSSLKYLREGMLDLLAAKLGGTRDLRTVDPRTLLRAWRQAGGSTQSDIDREGALKVASEVGAGRLLEGEVIGTPRHLVLNARLGDAGGRGEVRATAEGPSDSLTSLVDRMAAQLLVRDSGEEQHRLAAFTTTSLPALRAYLDGRSAYRQGDFHSARAMFDRAMELDSSFALAGLGRTSSAIWLGEPYEEAPGTLMAWRHRDRLSRRDLLLLRFMLGSRYPLLTSQSESMADLEALVVGAPDSPEAWAMLGDHMYHYGSQVGITDALERSLRAYKRAISLDSTFAPSFQHLHELYYLTGDRAAARKALILQLRADSTSQDAAVARWFARRLLRDTVVGAISLRHDSLLVRTRSIIRIALEYAIGLADAESLLTLRGATVSSTSERNELQDIRWTFYLARGQPKRAVAGMRIPATPADRTAAILAALYADADLGVAAKAAAQVSRVFARPTLRSNREEILEQYAVAQHDLAYGSTEAARQAVRTWKGLWTPQDTSLVLFVASYYAMLLDAQLAALARRSDALTRLLELDSLLQAAPTSGRREPVGNIIAAELWYRRGDFVRALASVRRREVGLWSPWGDVRCLYIASLRDEGRYAALAGDRAGAIRTYRHYLALRSDPEPSVRPKVEEVRAELAALERESPDQ